MGSAEGTDIDVVKELSPRVRAFINELMEAPAGCVRYSLQVATLLEMPNKMARYTEDEFAAFTLFDVFCVKEFNLSRSNKKVHCIADGHYSSAKTTPLAICAVMLMLKG
jgi:hypothetical protein